MKQYFDQLCKETDLQVFANLTWNGLIYQSWFLECIMVTILWSYVLLCSIWQITCFKAILVQASFSPFNMFPPDIWRELLSGQFEKDEFYDLQFLF